MKRDLGWLIGGLVIVLIVASLPLFSFCDGHAPGWVENNHGCAYWRPIEYLFPWHWGIPDQCLGLCGGPTGS